MTLSNGEQLNLFEFKEKYPSLGFQLENIKKKWNIDENKILKELEDLFYEYLGVNIKEHSEIIDIIIEMFKDDKFSEKFDKYLKIVDLVKRKYPEKIETLTKPSEFLKKVKGEVFTPLKGIVKMLSYIPIKMWRNPNLKWLDTSSGTGNILFLIYDILMGNGEKYGINTDGLKEIIPDEEERRKHIVENMLYGFEIQLKNVVVSKLRLNPDGKYKDNIIHGDFFELINEKEYKNLFDVIVSNPPYQYKDEKTVGEYRTTKGYKKIWDKFLINSINHLLKDKGKLIFMIPTNWKDDEEVIKFLFKNGSIDELYVFDYYLFPGNNVVIDILSYTKGKEQKEPVNGEIFFLKKKEEIYPKTFFDEWGFISHYPSKKVIEIMRKIKNEEKKIRNSDNYQWIKIRNYRKTREGKDFLRRFDYGILTRKQKDFKPITIREFYEKFEKETPRFWLIPLNNLYEEKILIDFFNSEIPYFFSPIVKINFRERPRWFYEILVNIVLFHKDSELNQVFSKQEIDCIKTFLKRIKENKRWWSV